MKDELLKQARELYIKHGSISVVFLMYKLKLNHTIAEDLKNQVLDEFVQSIHKRETRNI
jgi:hypothetical protein